MARVKPFGGRIEPACEYCQWGQRSTDGTMILCSKRGIVALRSSCKLFTYNPLLRIPRGQPTLPSYTAEDFTIDTPSEEPGK